jgi:thiamine biosynthesis lipoprotein
MVEIGGEVRARGKNSRGQDWRIGIKRPVASLIPDGDYQWIYSLRDQAVATSGDYQNFFELDGKAYSHEIDPRTGYPVRNDTASATVVAPTCMDADSLATALMVMDTKEGLELIESLPNVEAFVILRNGKDGFEFLKSSGMILTEQ